MPYYRVKMDVVLESDLSEKDINSMLVVALYDSNTENMTPDGASDKLRVVEYEAMDIEEIEEGL